MVLIPTYSLLSLESFGTDFRACVSGDHQSFYGEHVGVKWSSTKEVEQNFFPGLYLCPCKSPGIKMQTNLTTHPSNLFPSCTLCLIYICFSYTSDILKVIICHDHVLI